MKKLSVKRVLIGGLCALSIGVRAELVQYLSAADAAWVDTDASSVVWHWFDQSGALNDAISSVNSVYFQPGATLNASGRPGLAFNASSLELFSATEKEAMLDFTGAAAGKSGFAVLIGFEVGAQPTDFCDLLGTTTLLSDSQGLMLRFLGGRAPLCVLGGTKLSSSGGTPPVGVPVVLAINYDAATGLLTLWNSQGDKTDSTIKAVGDFSNGSPFRIGRTNGGDSRSLNGLIGEVRVFDHALNSLEFQAAKADVVAAWGVDVVVPLVIAPNGFSALACDDAVSLDWYDSSQQDILAGYNVYRAVGTGPFERVASGVPDSRWLDTDVQTNTLYTYAVTAISIEGDESDLSREWPATLFVYPSAEEPPAVHTGSVVLNNNDGANTATKTWVFADLNSANPPIGGSVAEATGQFSGAGNLDASQFSLTVSSVMGWNTIDAQTAAINDTFGNYLAGLESGRVDGLRDGTLGADSRVVYADDDPATLGQGTPEALVYTVDAENLIWGDLYLLKMHFTLFGINDRCDVVIYDVSANELIAAYWDFATQTDSVSGDWKLDDGDMIIIGTGLSNGMNEFRVNTLELDVITDPSAPTPPAVPTGLTAVGGDGVINLDWNDSVEFDLAGYGVFRADSASATSYVNIANVSQSDYADTAVWNGVTYYYVVTAYDTDGLESGPGTEVSATPVGWVELAYDDFDAGWGRWTGPTANCVLSTNYAAGGSGQCVDINNQYTTSETWLFAPLNLTESDQLKVEFTFVTAAFDYSETFAVCYSPDSGRSWVDLREYTNGVDFVRYNRYDMDDAHGNALIVDRSGVAFTDNALIKFQSRANQNADHLYIDNVRISVK